ncbi:MAG: hypothetical protein ACI8SA_002290, partial [Dokdonia sp.]
MKVFTTLFLSLISFYSFSQTGPGGVGDASSNGMWLKADDITLTNGAAVTSWADASGNGNGAAQGTATKQPTFISSANMNGMPTVRFDGILDEMTILDDNILDGTSGITFYVAIRPSNLNNSPQGILGKRNSYSDPTNYSYTWFFYSNLELYADIGKGNRFSTGIANPLFANNTNYILSLGFDGTLPQATRSSMKNAGTTIKQGSSPLTSVTGGSSDLALGALNVGYTNYLGADYSEVIHFNFALNSTQHILVQNYLSAKYDVTLSSNNIYSQSSASNGDYDFDVAGIGQVSATDAHTEAQGSGIVRILNPSGLADDEFLIWGRDAGDFYFTDNTDVPGSILARLDRTWRVSEVDASGTAVDVGNIDMYFDLTNLSAYNAADLRLLIDQNNNNDFTDDPVITGTVVGSSLQFSISSTELEDGERFTLASTSEGDITWDGTTYDGGSGNGSAPNTSDAGKTLKVYAPNAILPMDAKVAHVIITSTGKLNIPSGTILEVSGTITNNGEITLENNSSLLQTIAGSDQNTGPGSYLINRTGNNSAYSYNIWSAPIKAAALNTVFSSSNVCDIWTFNENNQSWSHDYAVGYATSCYGNAVTFTASDVITGGDGIMDIGRGYFVPGAVTTGR